MTRSVTVIVKLVDGSHSAGVEMSAGSLTWVKAETGGANNVFRVKKGAFRLVGTQTELLRSQAGFRVGRFENFNVATVVNGATGQGLSDDAGSAITWKVDGIVEV